MYDYIKGSLAEIAPTEAVVENNGIGYRLQISLQTYADIQSLEHVKLYIYHHLREDAELWYGFYKKEERRIFTMLIEVSGIGPNTARMMLSSMTEEEIKNAIIAGDVNRIKSIKGIGLKTAQRVIIELKDKIMKGGNTPMETLLPANNSANRDEALSALVLLGFAKNAAEKVLAGILKENPDCSLEELIKIALKRL
ncbi:MAG: Holliday junction branch migration protein RuvA [Bacteroidales bacterium]|nr:Holliday junction branch migration protein RuvA [Bacteroidales bacterium]MBP3343598.1 Holliday junction branch migration protein RuvA [Bacteroidales bacterium]MBQ3521619.1 Holliday junction branch migration protein RuvA [Bacteroidales bacterium]MBQ6872451.1 Holliday junction branch migration protein RuvA [Bacteroidales bacterium]MBQ7999419.1 Holliday junction branch migration protein RuvA [Bacteroidales bacterium]